MREQSQDISTTELREAIIDAGVWEAGHFVFANGGHSTVKLKMDRLKNSPEAFQKALLMLSQMDGESGGSSGPRPDVVLGVPRGGQELAEGLVERGLLRAPWARLERVPGGERRDFRFQSSLDRERALDAQRVYIYEDVVTTFSSIAGVVRLLEPDRQDIHARAIWRRGTVHDEYRGAVRDRYLIEEELPVWTAEECPVCATSF